MSPVMGCSLWTKFLQEGRCLLPWLGSGIVGRTGAGIDSSPAMRRAFLKRISHLFAVAQVGGGSNVFNHGRFIATIEFRATHTVDPYFFGQRCFFRDFKPAFFKEFDLVSEGD